MNNNSKKKEKFDNYFFFLQLQTRVSVWLEVPKVIVGRSNHTLAAVLKLIDMQLPKVNATWAIAETEKLSNEISVYSFI